MPNTPRLGLPYPALTDAPNVPQHMQNLATAVDDRLGGTWTAFTLTDAGSSGITLGNATQQNFFKAFGNRLVAFRITVTLGSTSSVTGTLVLGPLPFTITTPAQVVTANIFRGISAMQNATGFMSGTQVNRLLLTNGIATSTNPFNPWAAGDIIRVQGVVEGG